MNEDQIKEMTETTSRSKSNTHRLDDVERRLDDNEKLVTSVALMAQKQDAMEGDIREIKTDVKSLADKPAKRWEMLTTTVIAALATGIIGYLLAAAGLGS